jgi:hypothetical protein
MIVKTYGQRFRVMNLSLIPYIASIESKRVQTPCLLVSKQVTLTREEQAYCNGNTLCLQQSVKLCCLLSKSVVKTTKIIAVSRAYIP